MGRFHDAWQTLRGRTDIQISQAAQLVRIQAEWSAICAEIYNLLEQLNRLDGRIRKREQRAEKKTPPEPTSRPISSPKPWKSHKDELRARLRGQAIAGPTPEAPDELEPTTEETG